MSQDVLLQLSGILIVGVLAQWIAWRVHVPSIVLLLAVGIAAGPVTELIQPDKLFGDLLLPLVSLSVAVILYEGGLSLRLRELKQHELFGAFFRIVTITVLLAWVIGAVAAHYVMRFQWPVAALLGAILVVTGPTVIGPMLRHLRLGGRVGALLKWEGIVVDPLGAILAVLVFTVARNATLDSEFAQIAADFAGTLAAGVAVGLVAASLFVLALRFFWVPDGLHNPLSLALVVASFVAANQLQHEAGLVAVTVMGIMMANQKWVAIRHIVEFKETVATLLITVLFVILAARLRVEDLRSLGWESACFVAIMIVVARPVSVFCATVGSTLSWKERLFLSCMAPRGIVAAAVASIFALEFVASGFPRAIEMVPLTFFLVMTTVLFYSLLAGPLARRLELVTVNPQGVLFVGAHSWARAMAHALHTEGFAVELIDSDWENVCHTRMAGLRCHYGSALSESIREDVDLSGLGRLLAITTNNEVNSLACTVYREDFGGSETYQLQFDVGKQGRHEIVPLEHRGRFLFGTQWSFCKLSELSGESPTVKKTKMTAEFDFAAFQEQHGGLAVPLFVLKSNRIVKVITADGPVGIQPGDVLLSLTARTDYKPPNQSLQQTAAAGSVSGCS